MARSYRKSPSLGISDCGANRTRRYFRKARRNHNRRVVAFIMGCVEAADDAVFMTRQEADGNHWGTAYVGNILARDFTDDADHKDRLVKALRK